MSSLHVKGERRLMKDLERVEAGEPVANRKKNATPHSRYEEGTKKKFFRKKGRLRFKTGRKTPKRAQK